MKALSLRPRSAVVLLFLVLVGFLAATYSFRRITDTTLNSFQTRALVLHGDIDVDRYERLHHVAYFKVRRDGHLYSIYGVGVSLAAAPMYLVLAHLGASDALLQAAGAIPYVAAAIVLMLWLLLRLTRPAVAAAGALIFGFGTTLWPVASMALYQHASVLFFQMLGLLGLFSMQGSGPALAGLGFGAAVLIRPTTAFPFALVGLYYLTRGKRPVARYILGSALPMIAMVVQNRWIWGEWLTGGYSHSGIGFKAYWPEALWGLTLGLWRGIFVYSPVLAVGLIGWVMSLRRFRGVVEQRLAVLGLSSVATILFYSKWTTWWNGLHQFGYRYLIDIVPYLVVLGAYAVSKSERVQRIAMPFAVLTLMTMTFGAGPDRFGFDGVWHGTNLVDTSLGQAWIAFLDAPLGGILRLAGVAGVGALLYLFASRVWKQEATPLFEGTPSTASSDRGGGAEASAVPA